VYGFSRASSNLVPIANFFHFFMSPCRIARGNSTFRHPTAIHPVVLSGNQSMVFWSQRKPRYPRYKGSKRHRCVSYLKDTPTHPISQPTQRVCGVAVLREPAGPCRNLSGRPNPSELPRVLAAEVGTALEVTSYGPYGMDDTMSRVAKAQKGCDSCFRVLPAWFLGSEVVFLPRAAVAI
jgi:hypothetical protein